MEDNDIPLSTRGEVRDITIELTQQASKNIDIISRYLDSGVFNTQEFVDLIKKFCISNKATKIRILIKSSEPIFSSRHRMVKLIQQFSSSIEVRKISEEYKLYNKAFSIFDDKSIIFLPHAERYDGIANFNAPRHAGELKKFFNEVWQRSEPETNLQRIHI